MMEAVVRATESMAIRMRCWYAVTSDATVACDRDGSVTHGGGHVAAVVQRSLGDDFAEIWTGGLQRSVHET